MSTTNKEKLMSASIENPLFLWPPLIILVVYLYVHLKKRHEFHAPLWIFELPTFLSATSTVFSLLYFGLKFLKEKALKLGPEAENVFNATGTGLFYVSVHWNMASQSLLLPFIFIYSLFFFLKSSENVRKIVVCLVSAVYSNFLFLITLKLIPNFILFNLTLPFTSSEVYLINPMNISFMTFTIILLFVKLCCSKEPITFEDLLLIVEILLVVVAEVVGICLNTSPVATPSGRFSFLLEEINVEHMLLRNYHWSRMILPYLFILSIFLAKFEDFRARTSIKVYSEFEGGPEVKWIRRRPAQATQATAVAAVTAANANVRF